MPEQGKEPGDAGLLARSLAAARRRDWQRADRCPGCTILLASCGHAPALVATAVGVARAACLAVATALR